MARPFRALLETAKKALIPITLSPNKLITSFSLTKPTILAKRQIKSLKQLLTPKEIVRKLGKTPLKLIQEIQFYPERISQALGKLTTTERKQLSESVNEAVGVGTTDAAALSSSWLVWGEFEFASGSIGFLTLTTKQGKSYTYPSVGSDVWMAMKAAKGSNGSGAGSVFWSQYLRGAKGSTGFQFFQKAISMSAGNVK